MTPSTALVMRCSWLRGDDTGPAGGGQAIRPTKKGPRNRSPFSNAFRGRSVRDGVAVHPRPDLLLGEVEQAGEDEQEGQHPEAQLLAGLQMRFGGPHHESGDVLGVLG